MKTITKGKIEIKEKISFEIDGSWKVNDVIIFFNAVQDLYDFYSCIYIIEKEFERPHSVIGKKLGYQSTERYKDLMKVIGFLNQKFLGKQSTVIDRFNVFYRFERENNEREILNLDTIEPLYIVRYQYASKGISDLSGLGEIIGHIKDFCITIIELIVNSQERKEKLRGLKLDNDTKEIARNMKIIKMFEKLGFNDTEITQIIDSKYKSAKTLETLIMEEKIKGIK